jgi:hypothetical protein
VPTIEAVIRQINKNLIPQFEDQLREFLVTQDKEWLIDQIIRLALDAHSLHEMDRQHLHTLKALARAQRISRVRQLNVTPATVVNFLQQYHAVDRQYLIDKGYLTAETPAKGTSMIVPPQRTPSGDELLTHTKDMLYGLLFGDAATNTQLGRTQRKLLTFALPRLKASALDFMQAATELNAAGTWQDPDSVSNDLRADNIILEVEYGEVKHELVSQGIIRCLSIINNLEVNEQILYARMVDIEQSTLIE